MCFVQQIEIAGLYICFNLLEDVKLRICEIELKRIVRHGDHRSASFSQHIQ